MNGIGKPEREPQNRVVRLFCDELVYRYLGDWSDRDGNSNIVDSLLADYLLRNGYTPKQISAALYRLRIEADTQSCDLYGANQARYGLIP